MLREVQDAGSTVRLKARLPLFLLAMAIVIVVSGCTGPAPGSSQAANGGAISTSPKATPTASPSPSPTPTPQPTKPAVVQVQTTVIASRLTIPWGLAFLPDGRALISERTGNLLLMDATGKTSVVQKLPQRGFGEGGLLGIAISPTYAQDKLIYAYFSSGADNRVVRFQIGQTPRVILSGIPVAGNHNGGRIAFGPDGKLYIGTGDAANPPNSQNLQSLGGKILRINPDGSIPADNPFPGSPVYSYGHRNVQGLAWDANGQLYATEFGQNRFDEVNKILPGKNYGWPLVEGMGNDARFVNPLITFATAEASPSGATFLLNGNIPQWEGSFFMASLKGQRIWRLRFGPNGEIQKKEILLQGQFGRLRHVTQAPDGSLWIMTNNRDGRGNPVAADDRIIRLGPAQQ
ncbi:MAG: PQQ-dependent sugar dehydrogenase [Ktedonobacteraceae bacterium]|nr:PQQ-dependent sugar dehydrogenase [Ktedonobacteraceae bacterium]